MRTLRKILNLAVEWEFLPHSPFITKLSPAPQNEHSIITPENLLRLWKSFRERIYVSLPLLDLHICVSLKYSLSGGKILISKRIQSPYEANIYWAEY